MNPTPSLLAAETPVPAVEPPPPAAPRPLGPFSALVLSLLALLLPRTAGRGFLRVPLWAAAVVAAMNVAVLAPGIFRIARVNRDYLEFLLLYPRATMFLAILGFFIMLFFVALPFVPRPGSNRAVVRHLTRAILLSTTWLYVWVGFYWLLYSLAARRFAFDLFAPDTIILFLGGGGALLLYMVHALIRAVSHEYRAPRDFPAPRTPRCDQCGYELRGSDPAGRCSECGKPVSESLNPASRSPSAWEMSPSFLHASVILRQMSLLIRHPQSLFRSIPLLTHHRAAHRWLALMIALVGLLSFWIVLGLRLDYAIAFRLQPGIRLEAANLTFTDWQFYAAGIALSAIWITLGLMMVGIETAGIATIAHFRQRPVDLAASSKVTCYSSTLLLFWVLLGGVQVLAIALYGITDATSYVSHHWGARWDALITVGSVGAAQIGGLLWFEFTVYRGLWAIQYANH